MILIRTAKAMARALDSPLPSAVRQRLQLHQERLAQYDGYGLGELAHFVITQRTDTLKELNAASPAALFAETAGFILEPECIEKLPGWFELTFILSDDGFGLVLLMSEHSGIGRQMAPAIDSWLADWSSSFIP